MKTCIECKKIGSKYGFSSSSVSNKDYSSSQSEQNLRKNYNTQRKNYGTLCKYAFLAHLVVVINTIHRLFKYSLGLILENTSQTQKLLCDFIVRMGCHLVDIRKEPFSKYASLAHLVAVINTIPLSYG